MIRARCLYGSSNRLTASSVRLGNSATWSGHKFYSDIAGTILRHERARNLPTRTPKPWQGRQWPLQRLNGISTPRFASTTPIDPLPVDYVPPPQSSDLLEDAAFAQKPLDEVTTSSVGEHLGFLKEMGLDYGWGPTAIVETLLEHVHIYLGTPWWASLGISIVLIRAAFFKLFVYANDVTARRQVVREQDMDFQARLSAARLEQDVKAMQEIMSERQRLYRSAGINLWKSFGPLLSLPFGFGVFRLTRGMATLPVPGLDHGGLLWAYDLTVPDPFYFLPLATGVLYHYAFKLGGESGNSTMMKPITQKLFLYGFPIGGGIFMSFMPAALQITFFVTASITAVQATLFRQNWFRNLVGIQPWPTAVETSSGSSITTYTRYEAPTSLNPSSPSSPPPPSSSSSNGLFDGLKETFAGYSKQANDLIDSQRRKKKDNGRLTDAEKRHGRVYEDKRRREIDIDAASAKRQVAQARFEREQEKADRDREREERLLRREEKKAMRRRETGG